MEKKEKNVLLLNTIHMIDKEPATRVAKQDFLEILKKMFSCVMEMVSVS